MTFVPDASVLFAFTLAGFVLFITPGPDMSLFLAKTIAGGRRAGIAAMTGTSLGCIVHSVLAAFGLSALIAASPAMFLALKIVGALYLLWLAVDAVRNGSSPQRQARHRQRRAPVVEPGARAHGQPHQPQGGAVLHHLPAPVRRRPRPACRGKLLFLGIYFVVLSYPLAVLLILGAERLVGGLKRRPRVLRAIDWLFAGVFSAFAVRILATQTR